MFPRYVKFSIDEINRNGIIYISLKVSLKRDEKEEYCRPWTFISFQKFDNPELNKKEIEFYKKLFLRSQEMMKRAYERKNNFSNEIVLEKENSNIENIVDYYPPCMV